MQTIVMIRYGDEREPMAIHAMGPMQAYYAEGKIPPRYPVPTCEIDNLLSLPAERFTFYSKRIVLWWEQL